MNDPITLKLNADKYIMMALEEDITSEDISTNSVMPEYQKGEVQLICKQDGIIAGLGVFKRVFELLDDTVEFEMNVKGSKTTLLDTRKTTPNMRIFEKYAVKVGGATNHRYNLSDAVMLKDNHIGAAGGITEAVKRARAYVSFVNKIENIDMAREAAEAGADIIMLDNMTPEQMKEAIKVIDGRALTECSGNVTKENIKNIIDVGVDYVSSGALTHENKFFCLVNLMKFFN